MDDVLIGRDDQLAEVVAALGARRVVTIVGPPGVGKTRLAAEVVVAIEADYEVVAVELMSVSTSHDVARAVAEALGMSNAAGDTAVESAAALVGEGRVLLSLDNCEHVLGGAVEAITTLAPRCPNLGVLATSREPLGLDGELVVTLSPLVPADAMALFVARARPGFTVDDTNADAIEEICRRLDGLPLAIELAAARTDMLAPHQLVALIEQRLSTVVADATQPDPRHRTLDAAIAWSWDLLDPTDQALLRRLSVFSGGATSAAVRTVCTGTEVATDHTHTILARLVGHSLVVAKDSDRYGLLETVRHFARQQLVRAGESAEAHNRHASWAIQLAEEAETHLTGPWQREWIDRLDTEADNLRAAMEWLVADHQAEEALRVASALTLWWRATGAAFEGRKWIQAGFAAAPSEPTIVQGKALFGAALLANVQGDDDSALAEARLSVSISQQFDDAQLRARALLVLGSSIRGAPLESTEALHDCVASARRADDVWCLSYGLALSAVRGEPQLAGEAVEVARRSGDAIALGFGLVSAADTAPDPVSAWGFLDEALSLTTGITCPEHTAALLRLGRLASGNRDWRAARSYLERARDEAWRTDSVILVASTSFELAGLAQVDGDLPGARGLLETALDIQGIVGLSGLVIRLRLARVVAAQGDLTGAAELVEQAEADARQCGIATLLAQSLLVRADLDRVDGRLDPARDALVEAVLIFEGDANTGGIADCFDGLGSAAVLRGEFVSGITLFAAAAALRDGEGLSRFPPDHPHYLADVALARSKVSPAEFERAWAAGRGLSLDGALAAARSPALSLVAPTDESWDQLTEKEMAVVELVAQGLSDREISQELFIAHYSVVNQLRSARTKLGAPTRSALVREVLRHHQ